MVTEIISLFSNLVRAAFLPQTLPEKLSAEDISKYGRYVIGVLSGVSHTHIREYLKGLTLLCL
jgi:hypothetical protein